MPPLPTDLRNKLERTIIEARDTAEAGARAALEALAVHHHEPYPHQTPDERQLRNRLRAHARQLGDTQNAKGELTIKHLVHECAYEHWHRMLFARFLAENNLLIEPEMGVAVSLDECKELAKEGKTNLWTLAGRYAQTMLPEIFRADEPVLQVPLAREDQLKLEQLLDGLPADVFTANDSLGWCYQFWQTKKKKEVNDSGNKIGADELPSVTQLFTEDYMVDFLLDNTLGAWHAGKVLAANPKLAENAKSEDELRKAVALPGCPWKYLRFIKDKDQKWTPAAGTFDGWPKTAKELKCLDPCMGSGHFVVAMFERLVALRIAEEKLDEPTAIAMVIRDNLFGLEIDPRCTQIGAFNLALAAWRRVGHCELPAMNMACSGLAPNSREADWLKIAGDNQKLQRGMARLYQLFQQAAMLGSLINPRASEGDLLVAAFHELQPLLEKALEQEAKDDTAHEMAVAARGLAKAAEILAGQFTLVATNVPYLGRGKQDEVLKDYCKHVHPDAKADIATCFFERCMEFCSSRGSAALVTPQAWMFLSSYKRFRESLLKTTLWNALVRLGEHGFDSPQAAGAFVVLSCMTKSVPTSKSSFLGFEASEESSPEEKAAAITRKAPSSISQSRQLQNPDSRIVLDPNYNAAQQRLGEFVTVLQGSSTGDDEKYVREFWEVHNFERWKWVLGAAYEGQFSGRNAVLDWPDDSCELSTFAGARIQGLEALGNVGFAIAGSRNVCCGRFFGEFYNKALASVIPRKKEDAAALWAFFAAGAFEAEVRKLDKKLMITPGTFSGVPFDLAHWQKVTAEKYPHGLPKPFSNDPTQWLFNGHPKGADHPLHVAVARLLGYQWPRQTGSSFLDCPALGPDGLEKLVDEDGIVCLPSIRGEEPAAERLRKLLLVAYGTDWKSTSELELVRATGSNASDLEEWLRNDFFAQHCDLFHQRPFIWHIWDGRKRDGFHALVNYHRLAEGGGKGRQLLETLTYAYLGEWITRQRDDVQRGEAGADDRLVAALELQKRLIAILEGEPPFDLFVRWKRLGDQPIGWEPDINDSVRINIRPFLASDVPNGKKGAGILRWKPNIKWEKDRGKEPHRPKADFPWFWGWDGKTVDFMGGKEFTGERFNDCHYTVGAKLKARETAGKSKEGVRR